MNAQTVFDPVHGEMEFPPLIAFVASTRIFHRLSHVQQLGGCSFVYPSATHTRREHSLGVAHLAGELVRHLRKQRPELINDDDVLCVQLAGLLHDLGHGPFSHLFETFMQRSSCVAWSHEDMSLKLYDLLVAQYPSDVCINACYPAAENHAFVKRLMSGMDSDAPWPSEWQRPPAKRFLLDIVHSKRTGIDVDKLDYLARDALKVFGTSNLVHMSRILHACRVGTDPRNPTEESSGENAGAQTTPAVLVFDESVASDLAEVFKLRAKLHQRVYQHRAVVAVEHMLLDHMQRHCSTLVTAAQIPASFVELADYHVLSTLTDRFFRRPWLTRVPVTVSIHTKPTCGACTTPTPIEATYCGHCGHSTRDRPYRILTPSMVRIPWQCDVSEAQATLWMRQHLRSDDVVVHIVDIHVGRPVDVPDAHGRRWRTYDPLHHVLFEGTSRVPSELFQIPELRHTRTAYCYLPPHASTYDLAKAARLFRLWGERMGVSV